MLIEVVRQDFRKEQVEDHLLGHLIDTNGIVAFHRAGEWAVLGLDRVRSKNCVYRGRERRKVVLGTGFSMR